MLAAYYDCSCDSHMIFDNLAIAKADSYVRWFEGCCDFHDRRRPMSDFHTEIPE